MYLQHKTSGVTPISVTELWSAYRLCLKTPKRNVHAISSTINNGYKPYTQIFCKLGEEKDRHSSNKEIKKRYGMELLQKKICN